MRKNLRNRLTVNGERVTRRIKWYGAKDYQTTDGKRSAMCFIFCIVGKSGDLEIKRVTGQIGIDTKGRQVLPDFTAIGPEHFVSTYAIPSEVGKLEETAKLYVDQINERINRAHEVIWNCPRDVDMEKPRDVVVVGSLPSSHRNTIGRTF